MCFKDRSQSRKELSNLITIQDPNNTLILTLARGGIPLATKL